MEALFNEMCSSWVPPTIDDIMMNSNNVDAAAESNDLPPHHDCRLLAVGKYVSNPLKWMHAINAFATSEIKDYRKHANRYLENMTSSGNRDNINNMNDISNRMINEHCVAAEAAARSNVEESMHSNLWECVGGYHHSQPGSRLAQYGTTTTINTRNSQMTVLNII